MTAAGVRLVGHVDRLAMMGFAEVIPHLSFLRRLHRRLLRLALEADLVVPVDYGGFNLHLLKALHRSSPTGRRPRVLYYIPPKVWAWGEARSRWLARLTDRVAVTLPFEERFLRARGVRATYVGHPLLGRPPVEQAGVQRASATQPVLALFPGSREGEVRSQLPVFLSAAARLGALMPGLRVVVGASRALPPRHYPEVEAAWSKLGGDGRCLEFARQTGELLGRARAAIVKSGTVALECTLSGVPHVVGHRVSRLSWAIIQRRLAVEHVSLPNLLAERAIVPEYLQTRCEPGALAEAVRPLIDGGMERIAQLAEFRRVRSILEEPLREARRTDLPFSGGDAAGRAALMAAKLIGPGEAT